MSNESVPLPQGHDFQMGNTQALIEKAQAAQEIVKETVSIGFRIHQHHQHKSPLVLAEIAPGTTHKDLWDKYSQGVQSERPVQRSLAVARTALNQGMSPEQVQKILTYDPQYAKIQLQQGTRSAKTYTEVMTRSAQKRENIVNTNQLQETQQYQKTRNPSQKIKM